MNVLEILFEEYKFYLKKREEYRKKPFDSRQELHQVMQKLIKLGLEGVQERSLAQIGLNGLATWSDITVLLFHSAQETKKILSVDIPIDMGTVSSIESHRFGKGRFQNCNTEALQKIIQKLLFLSKENQTLEIFREIRDDFLKHFKDAGLKRPHARIYRIFAAVYPQYFSSNITFIIDINAAR